MIVNRFWQEVFGAGLVRTAEDLGAQGETPSHPQLLDWLAAEFRESGWNVKRMFRLLLTSATYRQSAEQPLEARQGSGQSTAVRGPRFHMDAEMIRDYALAASGLLVRKVGGPSVKPYQPQGLWEAVAMMNSNTRFYRQDSGEDYMGAYELTMQVCRQRGLEAKEFCCKKGDVFFWHGSLVHRGSPPNDPGLTRKKPRHPLLHTKELQKTFGDLLQGDCRRSPGDSREPPTGYCSGTERWGSTTHSEDSHLLGSDSETDFASSPGGL